MGGVPGGSARVQKRLEEKILLKRLGMVGPDSGDSKELKVLNRIIRYTPEGIRYEADPRHAEILIQTLCSPTRAAVTPGARRPGQSSQRSQPSLSQARAAPVLSLRAPGGRRELPRGLPRPWGTRGNASGRF